MRLKRSNIRLADGSITPTTVTRLRLEMEGSTDNQGRITVYRVELL